MDVVEYRRREWRRRGVRGKVSGLLSEREKERDIERTKVDERWT